MSRLLVPNLALYLFIIQVKLLSNTYLFQIVDSVIRKTIKYFLMFFLYFFSAITMTYFILKKVGEDFTFSQVVSQNFFIQLGCNMRFLKTTSHQNTLLIIKIFDVFQNFIFFIFFYKIVYEAFIKVTRKYGFRKNLSEIKSVEEFWQLVKFAKSK